MKIGCFDIETVPGQNLPEDCRADIVETVKCGNLGPEKAKEKIDKKMATDPVSCQVTTFCGILYDTSKHEEIARVSTQWPPEESEYECIYRAWEFINGCHSSRTPLVSFNGIGFDLPVLLFRAMVTDVRVEQGMYEQLTKKWGTKQHYDLMLVLSGWNPSRWKKFDFYLGLFGIGKKTDDMDGSKVYAAWQAKEYDKIQRYCEEDVMNLCRLFERVEHWIV